MVLPNNNVNYLDTVTAALIYLIVMLTIALVFRETYHPRQRAFVHYYVGGDTIYLNKSTRILDKSM